MPLFIVTPIASFNRAPILARVILVGMLAFILSGSNISETVSFQGNTLSLLLSEFILGASLAFGFHAAYTSLHMVGHLIDIQMGLSSGAIFDPSTEQIATPVSEVLTLFGFVVFFVFDLHFDVINALNQILTVLPAGQLYSFKHSWFDVISIQIAAGFVIASPILISLWLVDITLAFMSRSMPQAQIYFVGLPLKIAIGLLLLAWFSRSAIEAVYKLLNNTIPLWSKMVSI